MAPKEKQDSKSAYTMADYNAMTTEKPGMEMPDDPKPCQGDALRARGRAISEGRLNAPSRDEIEAAGMDEAKEAEAMAEAAADKKAAGVKPAKTLEE